MTTIACDGRVLAADGLVSGNGIKHDFSACKVRRLKSGSVVALTGSVFFMNDLVAFLDGETDKLDCGDDMEAIILHYNGTVECIDGKGRRYQQPAPCVAGSGGAIALGAMMAGANALDAVEIAAKIDCGSGGQCMALEPLLPVPCDSDRHPQGGNAVPSQSDESADPQGYRHENIALSHPTKDR